jgi:hypothetical protein
MHKIRILLPLAGLALLTACDGPVPVDNVSGIAATELAPDTSMTGEACDGHDPLHGLRVRGKSLVYVDIRINELRGGAEYPYAQGSAPADFPASQVVSLRFAGRPGQPGCSGLALRTHVYPAGNVFSLNYDLEMAPTHGMGGNLMPADAWRVQGAFPVALDGTGTKRFGFVAAGRPYVAYITAVPGPLWNTDKTVMDARGIVPPLEKSWGTPLPDEMPLRSLADDTKPAFRDSTFPITQP